MKKVRLGMIGMGNMGSGHIANILAGKVPEIEVTAAADRRADRREWGKNTLPTGTPIFEEGSALIHSGLCDAVLLAVPHYQHPTLAVEAFEAGLHVMCEKPAGVYTKAVREMNEAADRSGKAFGMMFNQRTNCLYRKMHEMVQNGELRLASHLGRGGRRRTAQSVTPSVGPTTMDLRTAQDSAGLLPHG